MITNNSWIVNGFNDENYEQFNAKETYKNEIINNLDAASYVNKIGLMYVSDFLYSLDPEYWGNSFINSDILFDFTNTWLFNGDTEWTISRNTYNSNLAFLILMSGYVSQMGVNSTFFATIVRPTFYLNSNVIYSSGDGSIDNPYRIEI